MKNISFISFGTHGIVFKYKEKEEDNIYKTVKFTDDIKEVNIAKEIKEGKLKNCDYLLPINSIKQLEYMNIYEIHSIFMNLGTLKEYKLNTNQYKSVIEKIKNMMLDLLSKGYVSTDSKPENFFIYTDKITDTDIILIIGNIGGIKKLQRNPNLKIISMYGDAFSLFCTYFPPQLKKNRYRINISNAIIFEYIVITILLNPNIDENMKKTISEFTNWTKELKICTNEDILIKLLCGEVQKYIDIKEYKNIQSSSYTYDELFIVYNKIYETITNNLVNNNLSDTVNKSSQFLYKRTKKRYSKRK